MHLIHSRKFSGKKILLIDKDPKQANDRTWCFWQKEKGLFEDIVCKKWERLWFYGSNFSKELQIAPYWYKMIRGIDFYEYCFGAIRQQNNFEIVFKNVEEVFSGRQTGVVVNGKRIFADYVFNSVLFKKPVIGKNEYWLLQHFKGWIIEAGQHVFNENIATLMDFRTQQDFGTSFCYVLPFNSKQALVEYTVFSSEVLDGHQYDEGLRSYIEDMLKITSYHIIETEFGVIPMTNYRFPQHQKSIINIGTAGGQTKGSSGYTFNFIQKHSKALVRSLATNGSPFLKRPAKRFSFYDSVLLNILNNQSLPGSEIFTDLFKKNPVKKVLKFLDNETTLTEELKIISSLPAIPFLKAGVQQMS